jgi:hypothetical protein
MERILERKIGVSKYFSYVVVKSPIIRGYVPVRMLLGGDDEH